MIITRTQRRIHIRFLLAVCGIVAMRLQTFHIKSRVGKFGGCYLILQHLRSKGNYALQLAGNTEA